MKFCRECKHGTGRYTHDGKILVVEPIYCRKRLDMVTGYPVDARFMREYGECGVDGVLWEEYVPPPPKPSLWKRWLA